MVPWSETSAEAILVLNVGQTRPGGAEGESFVVSRVQQMTAWGICNRGADADVHVRWLGALAAPSVRGGARTSVRVTLQNAGARVWRQNACGVYLASRWLDGQRRETATLARFALPRPVGPGETTAADLFVEAPSRAGEYTLELELVREQSTLATALAATPCRFRSG